jgi:hypothetical protein
MFEKYALFGDNTWSIAGNSELRLDIIVPLIYKKIVFITQFSERRRVAVDILDSYSGTIRFETRSVVNLFSIFRGFTQYIQANLPKVM